MGQSAFSCVQSEFQGKFRGTTIEDGAVTARYWHEPIRILWILKEANDRPEWRAGEVRSLTHFLANKDGILDSDRMWKITYEKVVQVSHGILTGKPAYRNLPGDLDKMRPVLARIAVVNVNKLPGGRGSVDSKALKSKAKKFIPWVVGQIQALDPDVIIGGNTLSLLKSALGLHLKGRSSTIDVYSEPKTTRLYLDAYHPGVRSVNQTGLAYYEGIMEKVREGLG